MVFPHQNLQPEDTTSKSEISPFLLDSGPSTLSSLQGPELRDVFLMFVNYPVSGVFLEQHTN